MNEHLIHEEARKLASRYSMLRLLDDRERISDRFSLMPLRWRIINKAISIKASSMGISNIAPGEGNA